MQNQINKQPSSERAALAIDSKIGTIVEREGRRPRIFLAHLETHQPDNWTKPLAAALAEFGFDVDIGPRQPTPLKVARLAIDNDVHMVCVSITDRASQPLLVQLAEALLAESSSDIRLVAGGTTLPSKSDSLIQAEVNLIDRFIPPDTRMANLLLDLLI